MILAVGGGSVCDYAKAVSVSAYCETDPWEKYYLRMEAVDNKIIPVGCVLTMVGTGLEMNGGSVITNHKAKLKSGGCLVIMCSPDFRYLIRLILLRSRVIKWLPDFLISCRIFWNSIFPELTTILPTILWKACCVR